MISASKILLQRLSATPTLQRISRSQLSSCRAFSWNSFSTRNANPKILSSVQQCPATTIFGKSLFSTSTETHTELPKDQDKDASPSTEKSDEGASEKKDDAVPPVEVSAEADTTGSNDTKSADSTDATYDGVPLEEVIRTGTIESIDYKNMRGIISQDIKYRSIGPVKAKKVSVSFRLFNPDILMHIDDDFFKPAIDQRRRVQFQAKKQRGKADYLVGFNVRYEGGEDIPMLHWTGSLALIQKAKASLGHNVYNILSESPLSANGEGDIIKGEGDIAKRVKEEFDKYSEKMSEARKQSGDPSKVTKQIKAKLGDEIYDLLSHITTVDNIERKADDAYFRCVKDLQVLELSIEPNGTKDKGEKRGYEEFMDRNKSGP